MKVQYKLFRTLKFMNKSDNVLISFLSISLISCFAGLLITASIVNGIASEIEIGKMADALVPTITGYAISFVMSVGCVFLSFNIEPTRFSRGLKYPAIVLSWLNAVNAFPVGLLAAYLLQKRIWSKLY